MKIVFTGGSGRFGKIFKDNTKLKNILYPNKKELNILSIVSIHNYFKKHKPKVIIHAAGLSRPMKIHNNEISKSIDKNIIGTCNLVKLCASFDIKIIYLSTNYVYPGLKGNYKESDPLLPYNNYTWSKLGGECAVQMYKNSLILRVSMTEKPFIHKKAFADVKTNFLFHEKLAKILIKIIDRKGIINVGGPTKTVYNFAKKYNPKVKKIFIKKNSLYNFPLNPFMNLSKLKKIIK